jgi:UDP-N-acetylmuramyl pentapeptide phosphotransferase/UDP-N-acetylglucosamine-1-phosphate transferase
MGAAARGEDGVSPWLSAAIVFAVTVLSVRLALAWLERRQIMDRPNERSSHTNPTPRGGGIGILIVLLPALVLAGHQRGQIIEAASFAALAFLLAQVSWRDDTRGLNVVPRLASHALAAWAGSLLLPGPVLQGWVPSWLDQALVVIAWVWFVNLFNFMDGIDGIAGAETAAIGLGLFLLALQAPSQALGDGVPALLLAAAALGFLVWNRHPARLFLGDVGSVPLGFLAGWLLLDAAARGALAPAIILPLYYCADASLTLARRLARGERVWEGHRQHWYQRAVDRWRSPTRVVLTITVANIALIGLAAWALEQPWPALILAVVAVAGLLLYLGRGK